MEWNSFKSSTCKYEEFRQKAVRRCKEGKISYEQAWEELKRWVQEWTMWPEQKVCRSAKNDIRDIQTKMKELEEKVK